MKGPQFSKILESLAAQNIKSITYGGKNELTMDCYEKIRDLFLER